MENNNKKRSVPLRDTSYEVRGGSNGGLLIPVIVLCIAIFFALLKCNRDVGGRSGNAVAISDTLRYYQNKLKGTTATMRTLQLENNQVKNTLLQKDKELAALASEFAKVHYVTKYSTVTKYDTIAVVFKDTVPCVFERLGNVTEKWYSFGYRANQKGVEFDTLTIPNTATVITGVKRKWFLGKETLVTDITNTNPHIKVTGITAAEVILPQPWFKKWYIWAIIGGVGGFFAAK